jgi:uncharacterized membrane protein
MKTIEQVAPKGGEMSDGSEAEAAAEGRNIKKDIELTHIIYALMAAGFITGGLGTLAAIIINYIKVDDVKGTWLESHFRWQMRTFWWGLLWGFLSALLMFVVIGIFLIFVVAVWIIYRIAKGWIRLNDSKPMEA